MDSDDEGDGGSKDGSYDGDADNLYSSFLKADDVTFLKDVTGNEAKRLLQRVMQDAVIGPRARAAGGTVDAVWTDSFFAFSPLFWAPK